MGYDRETGLVDNGQHGSGPVAYPAEQRVQAVLVQNAILKSGGKKQEIM